VLEGTENQYQGGDLSLKDGHSSTRVADLSIILFVLGKRQSMNGMQYLLISLFLFPLVAAAQVKYEQEYRVGPGEVPERARAFFEGDLSDQKLKWYKEIQLEASSYEAKFRRDGKKFSVEFDTLGHVEDVEIIIRFDELNPQVQTTIGQELNKQFVRYKIQKIQLQLTGAEDVLQTLVHGHAGDTPAVERYELVVRGKADQAVGLFEMLFDEQGQLLQVSEIIPRNTDILDY
jgi:hypothetical protein